MSQIEKHLPKQIKCGPHREGHVQGIAIDTERKCAFFSFTTMLIKTDLEGNTLGSVTHLAGHLGCIALDPRDGSVYGSLELKHDIIGQGIINRTGWDPSEEDAFYVVKFNTSLIERENMDAEADGIMSAVYLSDVTRDYKENDIDGRKHRYGCSGIDGISLGPVFGADKNSEKKLMICYGIYSEADREGNDHQVILQYDPDIFSKYGMALDQGAPHHSGPDTYEEKYFLYTGNTRFGIQNLEYDPESDLWLTAVYCGKKENFPNFKLFLINGKIAPEKKELSGRSGECGLCLSLADYSSPRAFNGIKGFDFPYGDTGICSVGNGLFYFSHPFANKETREFSSVATLYKMDQKSEDFFSLY